MSFQIHALAAQQFQHLFPLSDEGLAEHNTRRILVQSKPGYPCRVSLQDAEIREQVILLNYEHQTGATPYRASHAIYVRCGVQQARPVAGAIPESLRHRLISVRAFDASHMMTNADVVEGTTLEQSIVAMFENDEVDYIHLHNAKPGCYAAYVTRA